MPLAGETIRVGNVPGMRIATTIVTADSADFTTTETTVISVTAALVNGRTYRVWADARFASSVSADHVVARIREDSATGVEKQSALMVVTNTSAVGWPVALQAEFTAGATADKVFVLAAARNAGTGNCRLEALGTRPSYLYVDYIRG